MTAPKPRQPLPLEVVDALNDVAAELDAIAWFVGTNETVPAAYGLSRLIGHAVNQLHRLTAVEGAKS